MMTEQRPSARASDIADLRDWLERVDAMGELRRISQEVDPIEEMSAITYLVGKRMGSPALLFDNIKGHPGTWRTLFNLLGSSNNRIAVTMEMQAGRPAMELIEEARERLSRRIPPVEVESRTAPVNDVILRGDEIDLTKLPAPKHWPLDGGGQPGQDVGRYVGTADAVMTRDPDTGIVNVGTYRMMIQGKDEVGLYLSPGKHARLDITRAWERGEGIDVAACWGVDPLLMIVGAMGFPKNVSEYEFAGGIRGRPVEVIKGLVTDLPIPARAEIVAEGRIEHMATRREGPFGEFTGYYGRPEGSCPLVKITALHMRRDPIFTNALMAEWPACEQNGFFAIARSARIWDDLEKLGVPGIKGVYIHPAAAGGFGAVIVSLEQRYAGHAAQVAALAAQVPGGAYYTKWIITVDEDVDPSDWDQVFWAMTTRCDPASDIDILRQTWSTWLDPTKNPPEERPWGSKALVNACRQHKYLPIFSQRTAITRAVYERVKGRWHELGLDSLGEPMRPPVFQDDMRAPVNAELTDLSRRLGILDQGAPPSSTPSM
ncbi:MAG: UbiD family decarboxylase [Chloroflexi bacterium]|nr:UbiD family decarboxylase [Chloroflexota bacterium]